MGKSIIIVLLLTSCALMTQHNTPELLRTTQESIVETAKLTAKKQPDNVYGGVDQAFATGEQYGR